MMRTEPIASAPGERQELSDKDLLDDFVSRGGTAAFEVLLRRHGPMVRDVCQSLLCSEMDAEDAFQAKFLLLVQKATSIRKREALASWLHGVAFRMAQKARAALARRRKHEARGAQPSARANEDLSWR